jgi:hypothetical protein
VTTHKLKSWPEFFEPVLQGSKRFELRRNDRDFQIGDTLILQEYEPNTNSYTGRELPMRIVYIMRGLGSVGTIAPVKGLAMGFSILGIDDA